MGSSDECSFVIGDNYTYDVEHLPLLVILKNQQLEYLHKKP
jgi:hypothetical protein